MDEFELSDYAQTTEGKILNNDDVLMWLFYSKTVPTAECIIALENFD